MNKKMSPILGTFVLNIGDIRPKRCGHSSAMLGILYYLCLIIVSISSISALNALSTSMRSFTILHA